MTNFLHELDACIQCVRGPAKQNEHCDVQKLLLCDTAVSYGDFVTSEVGMLTRSAFACWWVADRDTPPSSYSMTTLNKKGL